MLPKICVSIADKRLKTVNELIRLSDIAEIRMDLCRFSLKNMEKVLQEHTGSLIAKYSFLEDEPLSFGDKDLSEKKQRKLRGKDLKKRDLKLADYYANIEVALKAGVAYVDLELDSPGFSRFRIQAQKRGIKVIVSYHNRKGSDTKKELRAIYDRATALGADIVKIVTTPSTKKEIEDVLSLYNYRKTIEDAPTLIAFGMGEAAAYSRIVSVMNGAPWCYVSATVGKETAAGQQPFDYVKERWRFVLPRVQGTVKVPSSKSIAQRAIIFAAIAEGESHISNYYSSKDADCALEMAKQMGADVHIDKRDITIRGIENIREIRKVEDTLISEKCLPEDATIVLFVGESGLLSRMMIPLAAQAGKRIEIMGEGTLLGRPMSGTKEVIEHFGGQEVLTSSNTLPAIVKGPLHSGEITMSGESGSQLISGLIASLPLCKGRSELTVEYPTSTPYIEMTYRLLKMFGIELSAQYNDDKLVFDIPGGQKFKAADVIIDGDWSSAPYFMVAAAIFGEVTLTGMNDMTIKEHNGESVQADKTIVDILKDAGAHISFDDAGYHIRRDILKPYTYDATHTPDLFPILAVLAAFCDGKSKIYGVKRLLTKESNRAEAIYNEFGKLGVSITMNENVMTIEGISLAKRVAQNKMLRGTELSTYNDHRIAMALTVISLGCEGKVILDDISCVAKSFPRFERKFNLIIGDGGRS